jgi:MFS family permease
MGNRDHSHVLGQYLPGFCHVGDYSQASLLSAQRSVSARFFLGVAEAGLFPGVTYYLSLWYSRREQGARLAIFFSASTASGMSVHLHN